MAPTASASRDVGKFLQTTKDKKEIPEE